MVIINDLIATVTFLQNYLALLVHVTVACPVGREFLNREIFCWIWVAFSWENLHLGKINHYMIVHRALYVKSCVQANI